MEDLVKARKVGMELYEKFIEIKELAENYPDPVVRRKLNGFIRAFDEWMKFMDEKTSNLEERTSNIYGDIRHIKLKLRQ